VLGAGEIGRINAGPATEQWDFESGVVRQRGQPAQASPGLGFLAGVFQVAGAVFDDVEGDPCIGRAKFLELALVRRGEQQPVQRSFSAFF
jgi:hypothetical protein